MSNIKEFLRSFKPAHALFNLFHLSNLKHNAEPFKKFNITRPLWFPLSSKIFSRLPQDRPWMDLSPSEATIQNNPDFQKFPVSTQKQILQYPSTGYLLLKDFFSEKEADEVNKEVERLLKEKKVSIIYRVKVMFAFRHSEIIKKMVYDQGLKNLMNFLLGAEMIPFQSINFLKGTEQKAHSDYIHMTTYPHGYLSAAWIALEDIVAENGPLFYYSGSHKLPYLLNEGFDHGGSSLQIGENAYKAYEEKLHHNIAAANLKSETVHLKKGDVFIWHGNLIHGGMPVLNPSLTRKSMVIHYFAKDVIKYHEIMQRPALMDL